eukprot:4759871-Amphidinium_carterae.1
MQMEFAGSLHPAFNTECIHSSVGEHALHCLHEAQPTRGLIGYVLTSTVTAFLAVTMGTVLICSGVTEGLGLSTTLGAFLAGVLLSETPYRHQIEADIAPFRGMWESKPP